MSSLSTSWSTTIATKEIKEEKFEKKLKKESDIIDDNDSDNVYDINVNNVKYKVNDKNLLAPYVVCPLNAIPLFVKFLNPKPTDHILEIGSGDGRILLEVAHYNGGSGGSGGNSGSLSTSKLSSNNQKCPKKCVGVEMNEMAHKEAIDKVFKYHHALHKISGVKNNNDQNKNKNKIIQSRNVEIRCEDIFESDIDWKSFNKIFLHLTTPGLTSIWRFLQDRIQPGTEIYTIQFSISNVIYKNHSLGYFKPSNCKLESNSMDFYQYIFPSEDRKVKIDVMNIEIDKGRSKMRIKVKYHFILNNNNNIVHYKDFIGFFHKNERDPDNDLDFSFLIDDETIITSNGEVILSVDLKYFDEKKNNNHNNNNVAFDIRYLNAAGLILGRINVTDEDLKYIK